MQGIEISITWFKALAWLQNINKISSGSIRKVFKIHHMMYNSGGPNRTGLTGFTGPVRYPVRFGPVRYFPQIPNRTFLMKCVPKWYLRLDFTFKSSKVAIFFGQISEISFQSHLIFIIQSFRNFEAGYIWKFICYEVRFGKVRFGSVKITGPVRFGKSGICLVRSTTVLDEGLL